MSDPVISAIQKLSRLAHRTPDHSLALDGQPFDRWLIRNSPLFKKSREHFLSLGGRLIPSYLSSTRSLGSAALLSAVVEYSALEREWVWWLEQKPSSGRDAQIYTLRNSITSLYHEQNHRILWTFLPPCPKDSGGMRRYLNYAESLVVILDMALADQLGVARAQPLYQSGVIYDPGSNAKKRHPKKRVYRNYLHAAGFATYLALERYTLQQILSWTKSLYSFGDPEGTIAMAAAKRALNLDRAFILKTNPHWQSRNRANVIQSLSGKNPLRVPRDPVQNHLIYLWTEKWLEIMGL